MPLNLPTDFTYVYVSPLDEYIEEGLFYTPRIEEINNCKSTKTQKEKTAVWNLFEKILKEKLGVTSLEVKPYKNENGKWVSDFLYISFSHSKDLIMVGISSSPIGVDIQEIKPLKNAKTLAKLALNEEEKGLFNEKEFIEIWSKKEAMFKKLDLPNFVGNKIIIDKNTKCLFNNYSYNCSTYVAVISVNEDLNVEFINEISK